MDTEMMDASCLDAGWPMVLLLATSSLTFSTGTYMYYRSTVLVNQYSVYGLLPYTVLRPPYIVDSKGRLFMLFRLIACLTLLTPAVSAVYSKVPGCVRDFPDGFVCVLCVLLYDTRQLTEEAVPAVTQA